MFKLISTRQLILETIKIYRRNVKIIFKILSLLIVPILVLRILFHYTNLQFLEIFYALLFGVIVAFLGILVKIMIIYLVPNENHIAHNLARESEKGGYAQSEIDKFRFKTFQSPQFKNLFKESLKKFISYIWLVIITTFITLSVPLFGTAVLIFDLPNYYNYLIYFVITLWSFIFSLLFVFVIYGLVLRDKKGLKAILYSKNIVLKSPIEIVFKIIVLLVFFGFFLTILSVLVNLLIAGIIGQVELLAKQLPWWAAITVDLCAILGLPFLIIGGGLLFKSAEGG